MFGIEALDVVIGMIFIYLLFSLFVSIINEVIGHLFNSRGSKLYDSILELIGKEATQELFKDHRIKVLSKNSKTILNSASEISKLKKAWPEHIPASLFGEIIAEIDNSMIGGIIGDLKDEIKNSSIKTKEAYEMALLKTKQTYKHNVRKLTVMVSVIVVILFNVDSISIFKDLGTDASKIVIITDMAEKYIAANDTSTSPDTQNTVADLKNKLNEIHKTQIHDLESTLGLGWENKKFWKELKWHSIPGWIITVLALSLGAPFWFDTLKRVINIKNEIKGKEKSEDGAVG